MDRWGPGCVLFFFVGGYHGNNNITNGPPVSSNFPPYTSTHEVATVATPAATEESSEVVVMQICNQQHTHIYIYIYFCIWNAGLVLWGVVIYYDATWCNPKTNQSFWWMEHLEWLARIRPQRLQRKLRTQRLDNLLIAVLFATGNVGKRLMMSYGHDGYNSVMNGSQYLFLVHHKIPLLLIHSPKQFSHQVATVATPAATEESSEVGQCVMQICTNTHTLTYIHLH